MKKMLENNIIKLASIVLFIVTMSLTILSTVGIVFCEDLSFYNNSNEEEQLNKLFDNYMERTSRNAAYGRLPDVLGYSPMDEYYMDEFDGNSANFFFVIKDKSGKTLLSNYNGEDYLCKNDYTYNVYANPQTKSVTKTFKSEEKLESYLESDDYYKEYGNKHVWNYNSYFDEEEKVYKLDISYTVYDYEEPVTVNAYIRKDLVPGDYLYFNYHLLKLLFPMRYALIICLCISALSAILLFVFIMKASGRVKGEKEIKLSFLDKVPLDVLTVLWLAAYIPIMIIFNFWNSYIGNIVLTFLIIAFVIIAMYASTLFILYFITLAKRIKTKTVIKNTVIYKILRIIVRIIRKPWHKIKYIIKNMKIVPKTVIIVAVISIIELIGLSATEAGGRTLLLWLIEKWVTVPIILIALINMKKLEQAGREISQGNTQYKVNTANMIGNFKSHGENLNSINEGIQKAVEVSMKSERMKTELITNVSHDIKTPITSIVNYVDLLKKESTDSDKTMQYIEVLDRQSQKLKKLTQDIIDASKAASGNIKVDLQKTDIKVLLEQTVGEYEERLDTADLKLNITMPENDVSVLADGKLLWRVFDNLLNNICKYAQPGTRVYIVCSESGENVHITFKNISKDELNISSDELMERFVRNDRSRNTEGSGLGLSIAKSLISAQNGNFELTIDGDLFKAEITLKTSR